MHTPSTGNCTQSEMNQVKLHISVHDIVWIYRFVNYMIYYKIIDFTQHMFPFQFVQNCTPSAHLVSTSRQWGSIVTDSTALGKKY